MNPHDYVGRRVTEEEMVALLTSQPMTATKDDMHVRSGALTFSFGPGGVRLIAVEERVPHAQEKS